MALTAFSQSRDNYPLDYAQASWQTVQVEIEAQFMSVDYTRIHRLLKILTLIQSAEGWTAHRLAQECGTTPRTIFRDLKSLEGAGIPYFFDPEKKCYAIHRDFFMPPVQLTLDESLALAALGEHVAGAEQVPYTKAASKAVEKIRSLLPASIRDEIEKIARHVSIKLPPVNPPEGAQDVYETVRAALSEKRVLKCAYDSIQGKSNGKAFAFKTYALLFSHRAWYAIGHHAGHDDIRCLKLNRFSMIKPTASTYTIPRTFSVGNHLGNAWRMIRGKKRYEVELVFDKEFAETVADTHWHATQDVEFTDGDGMIFRCKVDGLDEIVWWVMSMGPHCVVNKPPELAGMVREMATQMIAHYLQPAR